MPLAEEKPDIFQTAMRSYIIGIAACLETFFRDLYLHTLERNPALLETALQEIKEKEALATIYSNLSDGISFPEFAMSRARFRSAEEIDRHYSLFFKPNSFLDSLGQFELTCDIPSILRPGFARLRLSDGWRKDLANIFILRHEFAHDANTTSRIESREMQSLETTAVLLPQVTAYLQPFLPPSENSLLFVASKDTQPAPGILLIADLVADDWITFSAPDLDPRLGGKVERPAADIDSFLK